MPLRPITLLLLGAAALLAAGNCGPKPAPPAVASASYQLDGRYVNAQATATLDASSPTADVLSIYLTTTPQPASGSEVLALSFQKAKGHPDTDYQPAQVVYCPNSQPLSQGIPYQNVHMALTSTSGANYSGTFAASLPAPAASTIQSGTFDNVQL